MQGSQSRQTALDGGATRSGRKRVLVVDDEPAVRRLLVDLFTSEGYQVHEAADGTRGLDQLRNVSPDVIILDLMMPVMSGWAFAEECSRMACFDVPIIAISAMFDIHCAATALHSLGVRACLAKPFDVDAMLSLVANLV